MGDRFRLIHLKSTKPEISALNESTPARSPDKKLAMSLPSATYKIPDTISSKTFLNQAKTDLKHPDSKVKRLAIRYLESYDPSIAMPLIQEVLSDRDPEVRAQAVLSLIKFRNPVVKPLLKKHLRDSDARVRIVALRGLFQFDGTIDLNILLQFLSDESSLVRRKLATPVTSVVRK